MRNFGSAAMHKWAFYFSILLGVTVLFSFQNCGKVKFNSSRLNALVVPQSCGSISMSPQNGIYKDTTVSFEVTPPSEVTISYINWDFTKDSNSVFTSTSNPVTHQFNHTGEDSGNYVATATFMKSDGNGCELTQAFQILDNDLCTDPSGISGPTIGFVGEETSPFSVDAEPCFLGTVDWDMDNDGIVEYTTGAGNAVTYTYGSPGTYTVKATATNTIDNSQTILTQDITINYANCTNGATNPPTCDACPVGKTLVGGQCIANCTNGATNPPTCDACPIGKTLVGGQCVNNCTNGATNPPTCNTCPAGQTLAGGQCVNNCTNGATNPPTCDACPAGKILVGGQCVASTCSLPWGGTINQGQSVTAYQSSNVPYGGSCVSQTRTCNAGVLSGSYTNKTCTVTPAASCTLPWGGTIAHGQSVTAYKDSGVSCNGTCQSQTRTCNNGTLSGTYTNKTCSAEACIAGACGSANGQTFDSKPTTNLCSAGTATAVSGSGPWTWSCVGSLSTANCSANKATPVVTSNSLQIGIYRTRGIAANWGDGWPGPPYPGGTSWTGPSASVRGGGDPAPATAHFTGDLTYNGATVSVDVRCDVSASDGICRKSQTVTIGGVKWTISLTGSALPHGDCHIPPPPQLPSCPLSAFATVTPQ